METVELLKTLSDVFGPSGFEDEVCQTLQRLIAPFVDEMRVDTLGNLIATRRGTGDTTLMLDAHMDEIGFIVSFVEEGGFLRFTQTSGWDPRIVPAHAVTIRTDHGTRVKGYIGMPPPHILRPEDRDKPYKLEDLFIDVGATSVEEVANLGIRVGSPLVIAYPFERLNEQMVMARAIDDRAGCAVIVKVLEALAGQELESTVVACFSVQEEVGLRGAGTAAYQIEPDIALVLETTVAADVPGIPPARQPTRFGRGPAVVVMDNTMITAVGVVRAITELAEEHLIPWQYRVPFGGGTNAGAIQRSRGGVQTGVVSLPVRYFHSPYAIMRLDDFEHTVRLVTEFTRSCPGIVSR
ncbi:MAG TPA: M42 family metallopeptidase [Thermomicrobiales bacterium]|nr:M42 family metallopeptidase [Thermomicrobiales bacterium]